MRRQGTRPSAPAVVRRASVAHLAWSLLEPGPLGDRPGVGLPGYRAAIWCPMCQRVEAGRLMHGPAAVASSFAVVCGACGRHRTRWALEASVLANPGALRRLLGLMGRER